MQKMPDIWAGVVLAVGRNWGKFVLAAVAMRLGEKGVTLLIDLSWAAPGPGLVSGQMSEQDYRFLFIVWAVNTVFVAIPLFTAAVILRRQMRAAGWPRLPSLGLDVVPRIVLLAGIFGVMTVLGRLLTMGFPQVSDTVFSALSLAGTWLPIILFFGFLGCSAGLVGGSLQRTPWQIVRLVLKRSWGNCRILVLCGLVVAIVFHLFSQFMQFLYFTYGFPPSVLVYELIMAVLYSSVLTGLLVSIWSRLCGVRDQTAEVFS